jgi:uncharacterized Rmd1/YagE family protein
MESGEPAARTSRPPLVRKMPAQPQPNAMRMPVHALLVGERLETRTLERESVLAAAPLTIRIGKRGYGVLFRYGAVVLFDLTPAEEAEFLLALMPLTVRPLAAPETEGTGLTVDASAEERVEAMSS